jgi:two-component system, chemotaxis family, response regulator Rcp1
MHSIEILLVEDNPGDVRLTQEAFKGGRLTNNLNVVQNGVEAMNFLRQRGRYQHAPRPDIILLDLNLPLKDGREVLAEIKADDDLKRIPIIILTTSSDENDIFAAYNLHANCYITKPLEMNRFIDIVRSIEGFWFQIVRLPPD